MNSINTKNNKDLLDHPSRLNENIDQNLILKEYLTTIKNICSRLEYEE
jgi:hypothetical protein